MKITLKEGALLITLILSFLACSKEKELQVTSDQSHDLSQDRFTITKAEALALVGKSQRTARTTETILKEVEGLKTFADRQGKAIFYVITYKNNQGFLVLSADKRMKPVLAFSDTGTFDLQTDNPGIQLWKDLIAETAAGVRQNTEAHIDIINEWRLFEAGIGAGFRTNYIPEWTPEEYCEYLNSQPLPPNVTVEHLTFNLAHWTQIDGYNANCPNGIGVPNCKDAFPCNKALVGCGPLAIGEVLRYHHRSVNIEATNYTEAMFNGMPQVHSGNCSPTDNTGNGNLSHLLRDIGKATNATYNTLVPAFGIPMSGSGCGTWMEPGKVDDFFAARGFTSFDLDFFNSSNQTTIRSELLAHRPVIVYGSNCSVCLANMHIWVIDGVQDLHAILQDPNGNCYEYSNYYYQMNWGWGVTSQNNTWFAYSNIVGGGTLYNSSNMKAYIIKPN
jgi:hypothetical protein